jgi:hypothetical protein
MRNALRAVDIYRIPGRDCRITSQGLRHKPAPAIKQILGAKAKVQGFIAGTLGLTLAAALSEFESQ